LNLLCKRGCGCESHAIPSVIQCAVYLSQREVDTLEKGDKVGSQSLPALFFMPAKTNTLKVRRIDLLEQLEERYAWMTIEKEKYEKQHALYKAACDKYFKDIEAWEARIPTFLEGVVRGSEIDFSHRTNRYGRYYSSEESWTASINVSVTREELEKRLGPVPEKPEGPDKPSFLCERGGYKHDQPSLYQSVYQAIQLLHMSDDETVSASMYQLALEVL
jgi:hypothetical protein